MGARHLDQLGPLAAEPTDVSRLLADVATYLAEEGVLFRRWASDNPALTEDRLKDQPHAVEEAEESDEGRAIIQQSPLQSPSLQCI